MFNEALAWSLHPLETASPPAPRPQLQEGRSVSLRLGGLHAWPLRPASPVAVNAFVAVGASGGVPGGGRVPRGRGKLVFPS